MNYGFFCVADAISLGAGSCLCRNVLYLPYSVGSWIQNVSAICNNLCARSSIEKKLIQ